MYRIIDVSEYQPNINYEEVAKHVDGVILRCGVTHWGSKNECVRDSCFEKHYVGFKQAGVPVGAYYYSAADNFDKVKEEAEFCIKILGCKSFELPIYYDIENSQRMEKLSISTLTGQVEMWCDELEKNGYFVGVYANTDYFTRKLNHERLSKKYTIWLADYRKNYNKTLTRDMHQYTSQGNVPGITGRVDMNNCTKDFVSIITDGGFNKTTAQDIEEPEDNELKYIVVGPMSKGDYEVFYSNICQLAHSIGNIGVEVRKEV